MTSVLRVKHLEHERLVMEFLKKIAASNAFWQRDRSRRLPAGYRRVF
jgi:hypothetical protein